MTTDPHPSPDVGTGRRRRYGALFAAVTALVATAQALPAAAAPAMTTVPCDPAALIAALHTAADSAASSGQLSLAAGCTYSLSAPDNTVDGGTGLPVIYGSVRVVGNGATITRTGGADFRLFDVAVGGSLSLQGLTVNNGQIADGVNGGGGIDNHGTLSLSGVTISNNRAPAATGISGGGVQSSGTLTVSGSTFVGNLAQEGGGFLSQGTTTVTDSTFANNTATVFGGGAFVTVLGTTTVSGSTFVGNSAVDTPGHGVGGGAIDNDATVHITRSTFVSNSGGSNGGGAIQNFGTMTVSQSTIASNDAASGANIHNYGAHLTLTQSIVADPGGGGTNCSGGTGQITDGGYNLSTDASCELLSAPHSRVGVPAGLQPLAMNGGPTPTMAIAATSAAVDAIPAASGCAGTTDQRGVTRPQGSGCDIGAYELEQPGGGTTPPPPDTNPSGQSVFSDVSTDSPFYDAIVWLDAAHITTGFPDGSFHPGVSTSRQDIAAFLYRYAHGGSDGGACPEGTPFPDVPANDPFCMDITWMADARITTGFADGGFHPVDPVSRDAIAAFLYRFAHHGQDAGVCHAAAPFPDVTAGSPFCAAIAWLTSTTPLAITTGFPDGTFRPTAPTERQAMAAYLYRYDQDFHGYGAA